MDCPLHSPNLAPSGFKFFGKVKEQVAGRKFSTDDEAENAVSQTLKKFDKNFFHDAFDEIVSRWQKCVNNGCYVQIQKYIKVCRIRICIYVFPTD